MTLLKAVSIGVLAALVLLAFVFFLQVIPSAVTRAVWAAPMGVVSLSNTLCPPDAARCVFGSGRIIFHHLWAAICFVGVWGALFALCIWLWPNKAFKRTGYARRLT